MTSYISEIDLFLLRKLPSEMNNCAVFKSDLDLYLLSRERF